LNSKADDLLLVGLCSELRDDVARVVAVKGFSACSLWPFILVRPKHRSDIGLIEHELVHYREQAWIMPVWVLLYLISRRFRLAAEVRAYTRQIEMGGVTREQAAHALLSQVRLAVRHSQKGKIKKLNCLQIFDLHNA